MCLHLYEVHTTKGHEHLYIGTVNITYFTQMEKESKGCDEMKLNNNFSLPTSYPIHYQKLRRMHSKLLFVIVGKRVAILMHSIYTDINNI